MAKFSSTTEAMQEIVRADDFIDQVLNSDLDEYKFHERTIESWLEKFSHLDDADERKALLLSYEMLKTDAQLYLQFHQ